MKYLVGIDEAGRGPLAGPVAVGRVQIKRSVYVKLHEEGLCEPYAYDSKTLTEKRREELYTTLLRMRQVGDIDFSVHMVGNSVIDKRGITHAVKLGIDRALQGLYPHENFVFLDGRLRAPSAFPQQTVVNGDNAVPIIALASVVAKVERDRRMKNYARKHPKYGFDQHKGYGTRDHRVCIQKHGLSPLHRESFCTNLT